MTEPRITPIPDPRDLADYHIDVRFDFDVHGVPLQASWPVTRATAERVEELLASHERWDEGLVFFEVNRARRDVWINPHRIRECSIRFDYSSSPPQPTVLSRPDDDEQDMKEMDVPLDLYPLCAIAFEGSDADGDGGTPWLALGDQDAASVAEMSLDLDEAFDVTFLRFTDDEGETRLIRRRDIAFVDQTRLAYDEQGEPRFAAEVSL